MPNLGPAGVFRPMFESTSTSLVHNACEVNCPSLPRALLNTDDHIVRSTVSLQLSNLLGRTLCFLLLSIRHNDCRQSLPLSDALFQVQDVVVRTVRSRVVAFVGHQHPRSGAAAWTHYSRTGFWHFSRYQHRVYGPCSRAPVHTTREYGPSTRPVDTGSVHQAPKNTNCTTILFASTVREHGCSLDTAREHSP